MTEHAKLSASSAERWLNCTRAPRYEEQFPEPPSSIFAQEGSAAHAVAEDRIAKYLQLKREPITIDFLQFDTPAFHAHVQKYVDYVIALIEKYKAKDPNTIVLLERKVDFSKYVPRGFGTADVIIVSGGVIYVIDLKFGIGVKVYAIQNPQPRLYAVGAHEMFAHIYEITKIVSIIFQPRLDHISIEESTPDVLMDWAENVVAPAAALAWNGQGVFQPGDHCRWCRGKAQCAARAQQNLELARFDFAQPETLDDESIAAILDKSENLKSWVNDVQEHATSKALAGYKWPGYKLVESRSTRKYIDENAAADALLKAGIERDLIFTTSLNSLTQIEKTVGKQKFVQVLDGHITKAPGKPALVRIEDKRQEFIPASADFSHLE